MSRIVFDSNVYIPSLAFGRGPRHDLILHCLETHHVFYSAFILGEVIDKLTNKFALPQSTVHKAMSLVRQLSYEVQPAQVSAADCRDPNDLPILGTVISAEADVLVSGDKDLLSIETYKEVPILAPHDFWRWKAEQV